MFARLERQPWLKDVVSRNRGGPFGQPTMARQTGALQHGNYSTDRQPLSTHLYVSFSVPRVMR